MRDLLWKKDLVKLATLAIYLPICEKLDIPDKNFLKIILCEYVSGVFFPLVVGQGGGDFSK